MSSARRRPFIAGNWKMHKTVAESLELVTGLLAVKLPESVDVTVCPPFTSLQAVGRHLDGSAIALGAQNMDEHSQGAFTGEISPVMLQALGVRYVILGHCERRRYFNETDAAVARKVRSALDFGITPIVAVGETEEEHAGGGAIEKCVAQTRAAFELASSGEVASCVVAYEPIWAIGTGKVDTPESANGVMGEIRNCVPALEGSRILYGGSMKGDNAAALMAQPNIDGGLIGGASLAVASFVAVIEAAVEA